MKFTVKGQAYEMLSSDSMHPDDAQVMEDVLGVSMNKIMRSMSTCVCAHQDKAHRTKKEQGGAKGTCRLCDCDEFASDAPTVYSNAMLWVSMRQGGFAGSFEEWGRSFTYDEIKYEDDPVVPTPALTGSDTDGQPTLGS